MRRTTRTTTRVNADGSTTTVTTERGGCCGCGLLLWVLVAGFVLVAPTSFPLWAEVLAYIVEGVLAIGLLATWTQRRQAK